MMGAAQWFALIGFVAVATLFVIELLKWRVPGSVIGKGQKILRISLVVLMETLFGMILFGPKIIAHRDQFTELLYWTICLTIGLAVFVLAAFDLRTVAHTFSNRNRRQLKDYLNEIERDGK